MNIKNPLGITLIFSVFFYGQVVAQERLLPGKVTTFDSIPLIGASIQIKSSKQITYTDSLGMFTISCQTKDKLKVSANGFVTQNVKIEEKAKFIFVNLKLKQGSENRERAIAYGHVTDKDNLYAVSGVNKNQLDFSQYTDIYEIIRGRFPGVEVSGSDIIIRGTSTFLGSNAALLVVDGVIVDQVFFANLSPVDIASIDLLKDAAASAYGSRGANGVVIVETKGRTANRQPPE